MYRSVNIDRALYNNGSDCCNRKLQSHRNSKLQKSAETVPAYLKILPFQMKDRKSFYNINQAAHCRNSLCNHCAYPHPSTPIPKTTIKTTSRITLITAEMIRKYNGDLESPQRTQESRKCIICTCDNKTCINNSHICSYITKYLFRRIHQMQDWFVRKTESYGHDNGKCSHKVNGHGNIMAHPVKLFRSEHLATIIANPLLSPFSQPVTKNISEPVLPIAARAFTPINFPATMESAIL